MPYILAFIGGYLAGSMPTAFLIVRRTAGKDIRLSGSGNVGGFNAFLVTNSRWTGIIVGVIDGLKGLAVALLSWKLAADSFWVQGVAVLAAIVGHNYSIWLRFKGGRGLATGAGGFFGFGVGYTVAWCLTWFTVYRLSHNILKGNLVAIVLTPMILFVLPSRWVEYAMIRNVSMTDYLTYSVMASGVLLLSHKDAIKELLAGESPS